MNQTKIDLDHLRRTADSLAGTEYSGFGAAMKMAADEIGSLRDQVQNLTKVINVDLKQANERLQEAERFAVMAIEKYKEENERKDAVIASLRESLIIRSEIRTDIEQKNFDLEGELDALDPSRECLHCENVYVLGPFEDDDEPAYCSDECRDKGPRVEEESA